MINTSVTFSQETIDALDKIIEEQPHLNRCAIIRLALKDWLDKKKEQGTQRKTGKIGSPVVVNGKLVRIKRVLS